MNTRVEDRPATMTGLISEFEHAARPCRIEYFADRLGATGDARAVRPLLARLGESKVQEYEDVEDAVCHALVALDVMESSGNLSFAFRPRHLLAPDIVETIRELGPAIPMRYFLGHRS